MSGCGRASRARATIATGTIGDVHAWWFYSGIITSVDVVTSLRIPHGQLRGTRALHILAITHSRSITLWAHCGCHCTLHTALGSLHGRAACAMNADALAAGGTGTRRGPGRATADGRRSPPPAARAAGACAAPPARRAAPPLIHYLRTADRFQARSLRLPLHDDRSNLMPFLCPAF